MLEANDGVREPRLGTDLYCPLGDVFGEIADPLKVAGDADGPDYLAQIGRYRLTPRDGHYGELLDLVLQRVETWIGRDDLMGEDRIRVGKRVHGVDHHLLGNAAHLGNAAIEHVEFVVVGFDGVIHHGVAPSVEAASGNRSRLFRLAAEQKFSLPITRLQYTHGFNAGDDAGASDAVKRRTNPKTSGPTFVLGDIGTHIYYLSEIVLPHMKIEKLLCDRQSFIKTRAPLEDNAYVLTHYDNGAVGRLWVSSVNAGNMESQRYRFVGSKASVEWSDAHPDQLIYEIQGQPNQIMHHGMPYLETESLAIDRMGALHTEGLGDSWSNIYLWIAQAIDAKKRGDKEFLKTHHYPGIEAGTEGVRWLENCVRSADCGWSGSITSKHPQQGSET